MSSIRCIKFNNAEDQIGRTLACYQNQSKYCRRLHEFLSTKEPNFIQFGLKRTHIAIYLESSAMRHPASRLNSIDIILIPPRYTFFFGSPPAQNSTVKRA
jgi:hypothetical protein